MQESQRGNRSSPNAQWHSAGQNGFPRTPGDSGPTLGTPKEEAAGTMKSRAQNPLYPYSPQEALLLPHGLT